MKGAKVVHGGKSKENQKQAESAAELNDSIKQKVDKFIAAKFKKDSQMQDVFKKIEQLVTTTDQPKKKSTEDTSKEEHFEMEKLPEDFQSFDLIVVNKKEEKKEDSKEENDQGKSDQEEKADDEDKEAEDREDQKGDDVKSDVVIAQKVEKTKQPKASWEKFRLKEQNSKKMQRITIRPW